MKKLMTPAKGKLTAIILAILLPLSFVAYALQPLPSGSSTTTGLTIGSNSTLNVAANVAANITAPLGSGAYTESTAYSPMAGSSNIITVGTVVTGTWSAGNVTTPLLNATTANITGITVSGAVNAASSTWTGLSANTTGNAATATTAGNVTQAAAADATLSGAPKVFVIYDGATPYYFKAYPTKP